jgi:hypothetical protein
LKGYNMSDEKVHEARKAKEAVKNGASLKEIIDSYPLGYFDPTTVAVWQCGFEDDKENFGILAERELFECFHNADINPELEVLPSYLKIMTILAYCYIESGNESSVCLGEEKTAEVIRQYLKDSRWKEAMLKTADWHIGLKKRTYEFYPDEFINERIELAKKRKEMIERIWSE